MLTALVGVPVLVGAIWAGFPWLVILVGAAALLGLWEFQAMSPASGRPQRMALGVIWTASLLATSQLTDRSYDYAPHVLAGGGVLAALSWLAVARSRGTGLATWAYGVGGPLYVGFLLGHVLMLREMDGSDHLGRDWVLFVLIVTFATDTGAFFTGRAVGRHPMAPSISPGKTWEGAFGGFAWAVGIAVALGVLLELSVPLWGAAVVGVAAGILGQAGDLAESRLKRAGGVKDAGSILPGHGGILDRLDSLVFTFPAAYYIVILGFKPAG